MKIRRCKESREDFTAEDDPRFPISLYEGGRGYGFCPAKATWDQQLALQYRIMVLVAETGNMPDGKSILDQDPELLETLGWFIPTYKQLVFAHNAKCILGDGGKGSKNDNNSRTPSKGKTRQRRRS